MKIDTQEPGHEQPIRVLLADDHTLVRKAVAYWISQDKRIEIAGEVEDADSAIEFCSREPVDVAVLDIEMPGRLSFDAAKQIQQSHPNTKIMFVSAYLHDRYVESALDVGASGYVTKQEDPDQIIKAIHELGHGRNYFSPAVDTRLVNRGRASNPQAKSRLGTLSPRETEVLRYIARGLSKKEIAQTMQISVKTVDNHSTSLMSKLDLHDRVELTRFAIREGLSRA